MSLSSSNQFRKTAFCRPIDPRKEGIKREPFFLIHFCSTQSRADSGVGPTRTRFKRGTPSSQAPSSLPHSRSHQRQLKPYLRHVPVVAAPGSFTVCSVAVQIVCSVAGVIQQEQLATDQPSFHCASHHPPPQQLGSPAGAQPPGRRKRACAGHPERGERLGKAKAKVKRARKLFALCGRAYLLPDKDLPKTLRSLSRKGLNHCTTEWQRARRPHI